MPAVQPKVIKSSLKLFSGNGGAQLVMMLSFPILARIYSLADFGVFGVFVAIANVSALFATFRYELAIPSTKSNTESWNLFKVAILIGLVVTFFELITVILLYFFSFLNLASIYSFYYPIGTVLMMTIITCEYWLNRHGKYGWISLQRFLGAIILFCFQVLFGYFELGAHGLMSGFIIGMSYVSLMNMYKAFSLRPTENKIFPMIGTMKKYIKYPKYLLFAQLCNSGTNQFLSIFLKNIFSATVAGNYFAANRALTAVDLICTAFGQVYFFEANKLMANKQPGHHFLRKTTTQLFILSCFLFPFIYFSTPYVVIFILGEKWIDAGTIVKLLLPMYFLRFVTVPSNFYYTVAQKQKSFMLRQIILTTAIIWVMFLARKWDIESVILCYSITLSVSYIIDFLFAFITSCKVDKRLNDQKIKEIYVEQFS